MCEHFECDFENIFSGTCLVEVLPKNTIELNLLSETSRLKITKKIAPEKPIYVFGKKLIDKNFHKDVKIEKIQLCFEREAKVYRDFLNEIPEILAKINDWDMISPKMFDSTQNHILLEDLSILGYKSQKKFLDLQQSEVVFNQLAKFHALSYYFHHEMGRNFAEFSNTICEKFTPTLELMKKCAEDFLDEIRTWEGFSVYADEVEKFLPHYLDVLTRETEANPPGLGFNILCHGDLHIGNIMIEENTQKIAMVDYQFSAWRSPAYDLFSAFNSLCDTDVNLNYRDHLVQIYHEKFQILLEDLKFNSKIPTLLDVHQELVHHGFLDFYNWTYYLPLLLHYDRVEEDFQKRFLRSLQDPNYKKIVRKLLPKLIENGHFSLQ